MKFQFQFNDFWIKIVAHFFELSYFVKSNISKLQILSQPVKFEFTHTQLIKILLCHQKGILTLFSH